jgi:hypothetical protein
MIDAGATPQPYLDPAEAGQETDPDEGIVGPAFTMLDAGLMGSVTGAGRKQEEQPPRPSTPPRRVSDDRRLERPQELDRTWARFISEPEPVASPAAEILPPAASAGESAAPGLAVYGDGADGTLTLVANAVLAAGENVKRYLNLDLAGFTLEPSAADDYLVLYVKDTLTPAGGTIRASQRSRGVAGGAGGGGDAGACRSSVWVYAKVIADAGTIHADGDPGTHGAIGATPDANRDGNAGGAGNDLVHAFGRSTSAAAAGPGGAATQSAGGAGGSASSAILPRLVKDVVRYFNVSGSDPDGRIFHQGGAGSGGSGSVRNVAAASLKACGGGGGGGGSFLQGTAGAGGTGGTGVDNATGAGGGGGGGGAAGGLALVMTESAPADLVVSAAGGAGGNGGDGSEATSGRGGGGGGGGGGVAILVAQSGAEAEVRADGGRAGIAGAGVGIGGVNGGAGSPGVAMVLSKN